MRLQIPFRTLLAYVALCVVCFAQVPYAYAIGISPPVIIVRDMLRNTVQAHSVTVLIQEPSDSDTRFQVVPRGDYAHYIKGDSTLIIPAGKTSAVYTFDIDPANAAVGSYEIPLTFIEEKNAPATPSTGGGSSESGQSGAAVTVTHGVTTIIQLSISGEEKVEFSIDQMNFEDTETKLPLVGTYIIKNTGNVEWRPDRIVLDIVDVKDPEHTMQIEVPKESIPIIKPQTTQSARLSVPHSLIEGKYQTTAHFYYQNNEVATLQVPPFNVFSPGTLNQQGELGDVHTNKKVYKLGEQIVLTAPFKNTGDITVDAKLETQLFKGEDLQDVLLSRTLTIDRRQEVEFTQYIQPKRPGEYTLQVSAEYGNRKTAKQTVTVTVEASGLAALQVSWVVIVLLVILIFLALFLILKRRKDKKQAGPNIEKTDASVKENKPVEQKKASEAMPTPNTAVAPAPIVVPPESNTTQTPEVKSTPPTPESSPMEEKPVESEASHEESIPEASNTKPA